MNFFEHQDWARRRTGLLVVLFVIAVVLVVLVANVAVIAVLSVSGGDSPPGGDAIGFSWPLFAGVGFAVVALVGGASGTKMMSLRRGGGAVAEMLGGRLVSEMTDDPHEQRLVNVVSEMAIASGTPVPLIYVLDGEAGINAFAAGHGVEDAAVAVTRGALEQFTRDELQGVIAHEFSHILNRDVRLNTRLTGLLFGILVLSVAGRLLLRGGAHARIGRSNDRGGGAGAAVAIGLALMIVGYIGVFFGRLIKQAVSRQREYLADASAVQFTRNPAGLASALKRIAGHAEGSVVDAPAAEEVSHFFFADGMRSAFFGKMLSTHPPLDERIRRLDPSFDGTIAAAGQSSPASVGSAPVSMLTDDMRDGIDADDRVVAAPATVVGSVGTTDADRMVYDDIMEIEIPREIRTMVKSPFGAVSVLFALLLDEDEHRRSQQLHLLTGHLQPAIIDEVRHTFVVVRRIDRHARLPVADLAMPALRAVSQQQYEQLLTALDIVIDADDHLTLHEYAIRTIVRYRMDRHFGLRTSRTRQVGEAEANAATETLLAGLARIGHDDEADARSAYAEALRRAGRAATNVTALPAPSAAEIDRAIASLSHLPMRRKQSIVDACAYSVLADADVTLDEAELLRVAIVALGCPLPPFLPTAAA